MKIAVVTQNLARGGGQPRVNYELVRHCISEGIEVTAVAEGVAQDLLDRGVTWKRVNAGLLKPEIAHTRLFAPQADAAVASIENEVDLVLANGYVLRRPHAINVSHFVHGAYRRTTWGSSEGDSTLQRWYQNLYTRCNARWELQSYRVASRIVAVSAKVKEELISIGIDPEKIEVILNGVDLDEFKPGAESRDALGLPEGVPLALFVGDIRTARKNLDTVLLALQELSSVHLAVVGDAARSPFPAMVKSMGLEARVRFLGYRRDVARLMRASDLFVFPSRYEACSLALLEALASGLPVVSAITAGGSEIIGSDCGYVMNQPDNTAELITIMRELLSHGTDLAPFRLAARAVAEAHGWAAMGRAYVQAFEHYLRAPSSVGTSAVRCLA
jgi:glycosyltransferase involved in cell wall biosynthesis